MEKMKDFYKVQMFNGHKTPIMTQRDAYLAIENLRDAVLRLDGVEMEKGSITILSQSTKKEVNQWLTP